MKDFFHERLPIYGSGKFGGGKCGKLSMIRQTNLVATYVATINNLLGALLICQTFIHLFTKYLANT